MTYWLIPFTIPSIILGHAYCALLLTLGMAKRPRYCQGILMVNWRDWVMKRWKYHGPVIGFCIPINGTMSNQSWWHELIHIRQYEDLNVLGAIIGGLLCTASWKIGLVVWATSGAAWLLPNYFTGWVRFKEAYLGADHERSAYAQTGESWKYDSTERPW
jgi:hypothetical protein